MSPFTQLFNVQHHFIRDQSCFDHYKHCGSITRDVHICLVFPPESTVSCNYCNKALARLCYNFILKTFLILYCFLCTDHIFTALLHFNTNIVYEVFISESVCIYLVDLISVIEYCAFINVNFMYFSYCSQLSCAKFHTFIYFYLLQSENYCSFLSVHLFGHDVDYR